MKYTSLTGLIAAPYTPFKDNFALDLDVVPRIAAHLVRQKVTGAFIAGTTGEWASLTEEERRALAVSWRRAAGSDLKLVVHVGHNSLADSRDLAQHAESLGADAIAALMPSFFRPATISAAIEFCRHIAEAAPKTPFYYYHIPDLTGVDFRMAEFIGLAREAIPTFRGIKFNSSDQMDFSLTAAAGADHRIDVLYGRDEYLLGGLALGAKGAVGSSYNYAANLCYKMMEAHRSGLADEARTQQVYLQRTIQPLLRFGGLPTGKAVMALAGVDCGPPRPPLERLSHRQMKTLKDELDALDFFGAIASDRRPGK
jgi:N-acetylneuraminate lyase